MSAKSKKLLRRTRKSLIRNSPLLTPASTTRTSKNSAAIEFECQSIDSSFSSVFSNNETGTEKKNKKTRRTRKIRDTEDLRDCFKGQGSTDSMSDMDIVLTTNADKRIKPLLEIPVMPSRITKKKRKPIFSLPDTSSFKCDGDAASDKTTKKKERYKKKIRYTQDLDVLLNDKRDSNVAVKVKSKQVKKSRLPSFLPPVDMIEENKKIKSAESSTADSDNKENDANPETTDTDETIRTNSRKSRKGKPRKAKRRLVRCEDNLTLDTNDKPLTFESTKLPKDGVFKNGQETIIDTTMPPERSISEPTGYSKNEKNLSVVANNAKETISDGNSDQGDAQIINEQSGILSRNGSVSNFNLDISVITVDAMKNENMEFESQTSRHQNKSNQNISSGKRKSKRNTFDVSVSLDNDKADYAQNIFTHIVSNIAEDQNKLRKTPNQLPRKISNLSGKEVFQPTNKTRSDFNNENSIRKSSKRGTYGITSNLDESSIKVECSQLAESPHSSKNRVSNEKSLRKHSKSEAFDITPNLAECSTQLKTSQFTQNQRSTRNLSPNKKSLRSSKRDTFDTGSNLDETSTKLEASQLTKNRGSTRNHKIESTSDLESLNAVSGLNTSNAAFKTSTRLSSTLNKRSTFGSVLNSNSRAKKSEIPSRQVSKNITSDKIDSNDQVPDSESESTFEIHSINSEDLLEEITKSTFEIHSINSEDLLEEITKSTFEIHSINSEDLLEEITNESKFGIHSINREDLLEEITNDVSVRDTYDVVPPSKHIETRNFDTESDTEDHGKNTTVIDLTESAMEDAEPIPSKNQKRSTFDKDTPEKRKSSFEVSFRAIKGQKNPDNILDHLNITRRDSGKITFKKSSTGLKYSTGSGNERPNFVTLRRGCHTMIDFDTADSINDLNFNRNGSGDKSVILTDKSSTEATEGSSEGTESSPHVTKFVPKKSILKKSMCGATSKGKRRDTFETAEYFYDTYMKVKPTVSAISEVTPNVTLEQEHQRDIFDLVTRTPCDELGHMMIGSGESVIVGQSFLDDTNMSVKPRLTRQSTFTKDEEPKKIPPPARKSNRKRWSQVERTPIFNNMPSDNSFLVFETKDEESKKTPPLTRKSNRKRWSQVERTPLFNKMPSDNSSIADQRTDRNLEMSLNKTKSVTIKTPPDFSPEQRWLKTTPREARATENRKKSVKIESPVRTPKIRLHSPLIIRKTPVADFRRIDNSILAVNCVDKPSAKLSPCPHTSTPYPKTEISLLQKVLTNEKNKSARTIGKGSVRSKMPNFAKIHQRQFEKMENLKEMQERKVARAQYLLSGTKPPANTSGTRVCEKESRKQLNFSPKKAERLSNAGNTSSSLVGKGNHSKPMSKPLKHLLRKRASIEKKKKETKSKVPVAIKKYKVVPEAGPKDPTKPEAITRFGFKLPSGKEKLTKDEQIKAITTKSKLAVNRTETNRNQLGGVRTNRRFELLMKMRENKNKLPTNTLPSRKAKYEPKKLVNVGLTKANQPQNMITPNRLKPLSKPLQHMLIKKAIKEKNKNQGKSKIPIPVKKLKVKQARDNLELRGFTRFGFKLPLRSKDNLTKAKQVKAVSTKANIPRDRTEANRNEIQRVRSNRRFELLMKLRESMKE